MEYLKVDKTNIEEEHICCAITNNKKDQRVALKKEWMKELFDDGLTFIKLNKRGKVFVEYLPAEKAWVPIEADNYLYINCFWVSGKFVKQGHGSKLLDLCFEDAKKQGKNGVVILSATKKMPFLSDPKFLKSKGFMVADTTEPNYELLYLPLVANAPIPKFKKNAKEGTITDQGMVLYYSHQCPHTEMYAQKIKAIAQKHGLDISLRQFKTIEEAQKAMSPFTTYSFFDKGKFITNEILGSKKFEKYLETRK